METSELYLNVHKYFAKVTQFLSWPIIFIFFSIFFRLKITGRENLNNLYSPFIIISNHVSYYDSFVFRLVVGIAGRNLPLRFMAVNSFNYWYLNILSKLSITNIVYSLFGVFVVVRGRGIDKNLEMAERIIGNGGNIVIYPEGSIAFNMGIISFKLGAATLAKKTHVPVIPVVMKIVGKSFRKNFIIRVGREIVYDNQLPTVEINRIFHNIVANMHAKLG